jgi:endoglucanase
MSGRPHRRTCTRRRFKVWRVGGWFRHVLPGLMLPLGLLWMLLVTGAAPSSDESLALARAPTPTVASVEGDPIAHERLFIPLGSPAQAQVRAWTATRPSDARLIERIASQPVAVWLGHADARATVSRTLADAERQKALPIFVTYFLPDRDCGGYSAGGAASPADYETWIREVGNGIGDRRAVIIVEPDALSELSCWTPAVAGRQLTLIRYSVAIFSHLPHVTTYIDAGNSPQGSHWNSVMATRLREAGIAHARGISVNVSNFGSVAAETAYGMHLLAVLGGRWHFIIDTSRDGRGWAPGDPWCNPLGRGLGVPPTAATHDPLVDAYLWIKQPGSSDGPCDGGPPAGQWWPSQALELARNAASHDE